jgi:hypothetical protein
MKEVGKRLDEDFEEYLNFTDESFSEALDKIKCELRHGKRIWWYEKVDAEYLDEYEEENVRNYAPYSGIIVAKDGVDVPQKNAELEIDNIVVVMDTYPVEKCYCEATWIGLPFLLANENLVEIFEK